MISSDTHYRGSNLVIAPGSSQAPIALRPPSDETTSRLSRIWQEMLGLESIGPDQNYFDLGGDSILAVQLFIRIEQEFGVKLPLATLFDTPTIRELAHVLQRETVSSDWSPLVAIQTAGTRPPFFCMHAAGGTVLIYQKLSQHLGADQPFFGLEAQGLDGSCPPLTRIEDMAALYVKSIRSARPHGPYFLGGYCMGGTIAFEVAQQLQAAGEKVALLALFDTMDWSKIRVPSFVGKSYRAAERLVFHAANFFRLDLQGKTRFLSEKIKVLRNRVPVWKGMLLAKFGGHSHTGASRARVSGQIWQANDIACVNYVPKSYGGAITDFRPIRQYTMYDKPDAKWDRLAEQGQEVVVLPVYPAGMLLEPFVEHLAAALKKSIDKANCRCEAGYPDGQK
jgi:phthiocerol/phenolphthiocerol synthesis type-I polyketide synthase E